MGGKANSTSDLDLDGLLAREWLVTTGTGGYASSTACGLNTRRYHGLLVAAMTPPVRRMVLLSRVEETLHCDGREYRLACNEYPGTVWPAGYELLRAFSTDPHPRWAYQGDGWTIQKELRLLRGQNTVLLSYTLLGAGCGVDLDVRPLLALRGMHELTYQWHGGPEARPRGVGHWHVPATRRTPEVFFAHDGAFDRRAYWYLNTIYRREEEYGYAALEDLWSPGAAYAHLAPGQTVHFACSADPFHLADVVAQAERQPVPGGGGAEGRPGGGRAFVGSHVAAAMAAPAAAAGPGADADLDALVAAAAGHTLCSPAGESYGAAAQYHWSPPSVRAALVGFAGLYLVPGRLAEAESVLWVASRRLADGLLAADLPADGPAADAADPPAAADVALWFVNAVHQYLAYGGDEAAVARQLLPAASAVIDAYRRGTRHGVGVGPDGLLRCGRPDAAATWMNAVVDGRPVTPRDGRPVELNALWHNALMAAADACRRVGRPADAAGYESAAARVRQAFDRAFWDPGRSCCHDVVRDDGSVDPAVRPNQLFAVSLPFPVLAPERWAGVVAAVRRDLLTPAGVRTLGPADPRYAGRYRGPLADRDRAAHNGSAHPWLLGPYVTALTRAAAADTADPDGLTVARADARAALAYCLVRLQGVGLGHLNELCDGDAPHAPGGAVASALSAAELLRCYAEDVLGRTPRSADSPAAAAGTVRVSSPTDLKSSV